MLHMCSGAGVTAVLQEFVGMLAWGGEIREMLVCVLFFAVVLLVPDFSLHTHLYPW